MRSAPATKLDLPDVMMIPFTAASLVGAGSMKADSPASSSARVGGDRYIDHLRRCSDSPQSRRASMAEHRTLSASEDGRHPSPFIADVGVADGINAAMETVKVARRKAAFDPTRIDTAGVQLRR